MQFVSRSLRPHVLTAGDLNQLSSNRNAIPRAANATFDTVGNAQFGGFGFLSTTAGFSIARTIIPFSATDTYGYVYLISILNTMVVSLIVIVATTAVALTGGILWLSRNWLISTIATWYDEIVRNTPLLLQILFWYLGVFSLLPRPKQSIDVLELGVLQLNNRGIYFPEPQPGEVF